MLYHIEPHGNHTIARPIMVAWVCGASCGGLALQHALLSSDCPLHICTGTARITCMTQVSSGSAGEAVLAYPHPLAAICTHVQVLHAWRELSDSGDEAVLEALEQTCCWQRVCLARMHDRHQVRCVPTSLRAYHMPYVKPTCVRARVYRAFSWCRSHALLHNH